MALCYQFTRTVLAAPAPGGNTQFKLDLIKAHTRLRMASDFAVRNPVANADNHGS